MIDINKLKKELLYDDLTGQLIRIKSGTVAGSTNKNGYVKVFFDGKLHYAHRLSWALHYMKEPELFIDHIDGNPSNNLISNLRLATPTQNQMNRVVGSNNTSGYTGVSFRKDRKKWKAQIYKSGKLVHLGLHKTKELAASAYKKAAADYGKEFYTKGVNS